MNAKLCRQLRLWAKLFAVVKLQSLVPESEHYKINKDTIQPLEKDYDEYVYYKDGSRRLSAFSTKYFYRKLKKYARMGLDPLLEVDKLIHETKAKKG